MLLKFNQLMTELLTFIKLISGNQAHCVFVRSKYTAE